MTKAGDIESTSGRASAPARLSVIVPVYNGADDLKKCLAALAESHYDDFDVLVVDDGSTELIEPIVASYGYRYMRIDGPGGPARARNLGVEQANGQYVVFIDADVCVHRDTLAQFAAAFTADPTIDAVIGSYDDAPAAANFLSQYKNLFHHYVHQSNDGDISTFWSGCGAMRRELFLACGGFDAQRYRRPAIEDIELGAWLHAAGRRLVLDRRIKAKHLKRWTFWNLLKTDIFDRGIPWVRLMFRVGAVANTLNVKPSQRLSVVLVYLALLALAATLWWPMAWIGAALLAAAVIVLNHDFYRYFTACSDFWFTMRVVPLHWLYFICCGFCVLWGSLEQYLARVRRTSSASSSSFSTDIQPR